MSLRVPDSPIDHLSPGQFRRIARLAKDEAGLLLVESKAAMVAARLAKRVRALNLPGLSAYFDLLASPQGAQEIPRLVAVLTTHVSHFFREPHHFDMLSETIVPALRHQAEAGAPIRVWSAGCAAGQELYSIAMTLLAAFPECRAHDIRLLGTDIVAEVIATAAAGAYSEAQLKGLSAIRRGAYLTKAPNDALFRIRPEITQMTTFRRLNLIGDWPMQHKFDVIFCRNVVIYFDTQTQTTLWRRFHDVLKPGGWLFLGHSERIQNASLFNFRACGVTAYRKLPTETVGNDLNNQDSETWH